jgi:putative membrane protein
MPSVIPVTSALAAALLAAAPSAFAQVTTSPKPSNSPFATFGRDPAPAGTAVADSGYIRQAIRGNYLEVGLGRMAESRAESSEVKDFAERMVEDHNSMNREWADVARNHRMTAGIDFGPDGQQTIDRLEDLRGTAFDQAYMTEMIRMHEQDLAAFQRMSSTASSSDVRELANNGVSTIQQHLTLARQVGSRVGVATTAGRTGNVYIPTPPDTSRRPGSVYIPTPADTSRSTTVGRNDRDERDRDARNDRGELRGKDRAFVQEILQDHLMHIRLAERAQREVKSDDAKRLARQIERDFKDWQDRWEKVADRYDLKASDNLGRLHKEKVDMLQRASKQDVNMDFVYARIVAQHLESLVPYLRKEGQEVRVAAVRRLADEELPVIREYLTRARQIQRQEAPDKK